MLSDGMGDEKTTHVIDGKQVHYHHGQPGSEACNEDQRRKRKRQDYEMGAITSRLQL